MQTFSRIVNAPARKLAAWSAFALCAIGMVVAGTGTAAHDLSGVSTGFTDQVLNAVTTALPIAGPILALFVGWRVMKRLVKA
jgi:hypothetical protein